MGATSVHLQVVLRGSVAVLPAFVVATQLEAQQSDSGALEEILVTAQKREESLQDATSSVTALVK